jgi:hypothetical protein
MQSLNELIAHQIECIHASLLIRKQGEIVYLIQNNLFDIKFLCIIRVKQITIISVVVIKLNKHQQYRMVLHQFKMQFLIF